MRAKCSKNWLYTSTPGLMPMSGKVRRISKDVSCSCFLPDRSRALINTPYVTTVHFRPMPLASSYTYINEEAGIPDQHTERGGRGKARHQHTFKASSGRLRREESLVSAVHRGSAVGEAYNVFCTFKASSGRLSLAYIYMRLLVVATEYDKLRAGMSRQNRRSAWGVKTG